MDINDVRAVIKENGFSDDDKTMVTNGGFGRTSCKNKRSQENTYNILLHELVLILAELFYYISYK
jgi:hypothetical protein